MSGKLISFEGGEGVGKSTCLAYAAGYLRQAGIEVLETREPGGTGLGERLRAIFLDPELGRGMTPMTELLVVFAARAQHLSEVIEPALAAGKWVLCDRFIDASYAYQGAGRGVAVEHIDALTKMVLQGREPDQVILLDAPLSVGMQRAQARGKLDRLELEQQAFFERLLEGYRQRARQRPSRYAVLDASVPVAQVQAQLEPVLKRLWSS